MRYSMYPFPLVSMRLLCCLALLMPILELQARQVFDSTDNAFINATIVDWPPIEWSPNQTSLQFMRNGVNFLLQYNAPGQFDSIRSCDAFGGVLGDGLQIYNLAGGGVTLTINPPVPAIAFNGSEIDGVPNGTFIGATGNEVIQLDRVTNPGPFYGAADIGDISSVSFVSGASLFCLHDMTFVAPSTPPAGTADLELAKRRFSPAGGATNGETVVFVIDLDNLGPDASAQVRLLDFVPTGSFPETSLFNSASGQFDFDASASVVAWNEGDLLASTGLSETVTVTTPASRLDFSCRSRLLNIATTTADTSDPGLANNLAFASVWFDDPDLPTREICDNAIDDDCDGRFDCADSDCNCWPSLPTPGGNGNGCNSGYTTGIVVVDNQIVTSGCEVIIDRDGNGRPEPGNPAANHACQVPRGRCGGVTVPAFCCDVGTWSNPSAANLARVAASCDVGIPGCAPVDPNYKEAVPRTNIAGYGYIGAGETISYIIHYENVGNANATDVRIIDVLDENLDDTSLAVSDAGLSWSYDPATRALVWQDPLLPPATPRSVSFTIDMRADAEPGTRARNEATILFPTADQPRTDTNFVEHVVPDPSTVLSADLSVLRCTAAQTPGEYLVELANQGMRFAYNVTATVIDAPPSVTVQDGTVAFAHPDDPNPATLASVIPNAVTTSIDTLRLSSNHPIDPCEALTWQIDWETGDDDALQRTIAPATGRTCDFNGDGSVDISDVRGLLGLRNQPTDASTLLDDLDGDGRITVLDARGCVLACDNPRCAPAPR